MNKRNTRGDQTFLALKDSLLALLDEKSADSITVDEICARCAVTKGAFYHHFASKEDLLSLVLSSRMNDYMVQEILAAEERYRDDPARQIRAWVEAILRFSTRYRTNACGCLYRGSHSSTWMHIVSDWYGLVHDRLARWQSEGVLRGDVTARELHEYCDSFTYGFSALYVAEYVRHPIHEALLGSFISTLFPPTA